MGSKRRPPGARGALLGGRSSGSDWLESLLSEDLLELLEPESPGYGNCFAGSVDGPAGDVVGALEFFDFPGYGNCFSESIWRGGVGAGRSGGFDSPGYGNRSDGDCEEEGAIAHAVPGIGASVLEEVEGQGLEADGLEGTGACARDTASAATINRMNVQAVFISDKFYAGAPPASPAN